MVLDPDSLRCGECGGDVLKRIAPRQYLCKHCRSIATVDEAAVRLQLDLRFREQKAARQLAMARQQRRDRLADFAILATIVLLVGAALSYAWFDAHRAPGRPSQAVQQGASVDRLKLDGLRMVVTDKGQHPARPGLWAMARNEGSEPVEAPLVTAVFFRGERRIGEASERVAGGVLAPGESAPVLIDLPRDATSTRQEVQAEGRQVAQRYVTGPRLRLSRPRLVRQANVVRLVGRVVGRDDTAVESCDVLVTVYDATGAVIGFGTAQLGEIKPGEEAAIDVRIERFGNGAAIAAWDYRIGYRVPAPAGDSVDVVAPDRVVRTDEAPEALSLDQPATVEALLADDETRADTARLEPAVRMVARAGDRRPMVLTELVNHARQSILVAPTALIARLEGREPDSVLRIAAPVYLYPGERYPVLLDADRFERLGSDLPVGRRPLPGARAPLEIRVTGRRLPATVAVPMAAQGFAQRMVEVRGEVRNTGTAVVRRTRLWVTLRDRSGRLTGFRQVRNLPVLAPDERAAFELKIEQLGADFASVGTLYQTE
ncbi:FxLYD domain-containing protein [Variovorax sp. PAMC 28711]|uniref:FxLYD domain-containing protein n=1 Tax=Variovorax sp. PAMC 28711 TaxID=1795631 RepID=UPI00078E147A|nr:FxLYD domain-containing protein [Variovorax sp. PAMC 28711]AMM24947.1 hypothetical protein AX767_11685 [Variovorax sp. PAMC 28711]